MRRRRYNAASHVFVGGVLAIDGDGNGSLTIEALTQPGQITAAVSLPRRELDAIRDFLDRHFERDKRRESA